ncbi:MAG: RDD family protein, partial [Acidimicrobiales bacterium]
GAPGPGWWIASDGRWYPPELHPSVRQPPAAPTAPARPSGPAQPAVAPQPSGPPPGYLPPVHLGPPEPVPPAVPAHSLRLAVYASRLFAYVVDAVITWIGVFVLLEIGLVVTRGSIVLGVCLALAFYLWYHWWWIAVRGQTAGMRYLRIVVASRATGKHPVGPGRAFVRMLVALVLGVIPFAGLVDLLWPLWDPRNQTLHDKAASTVVLNVS